MDLDELRISRAAIVTVAQAASVFGVDVRTVARAIENGELPAVRLGRRVRIPRLPPRAPGAPRAASARAVRPWSRAPPEGTLGPRPRPRERRRRLP